MTMSVYHQNVDYQSLGYNRADNVYVTAPDEVI